MKRIEILDSDLFCLILFTLLFKEASQKIELFRTFLIVFILLYKLFDKIQVLCEWSLSMIYWCGAQF